MAKIAYFVHGRGSGHASRARTIVEHLRRRGHQVELSAGGDALRLLADEPTLRTIAPVLPGLGGLPIGLTRLREDLQFLAQRRADVVVTDGDAPGLHAARIEGIPCVAIGHGLLFNNANVGPLPWVPKLYERFNAASSCWIAQRKVAVHFLHGVANDSRTVVARPDLSHVFGPAMVADRPYVVAYFRDRNGHEMIAHALDQGFDVRYFGSQNDAPTGTLIHDLRREEFIYALRGCVGVLSSAGSNILAEAIALGKPVLACHGAYDHEQRMNAILLERAGLGRALCLDRYAASIVHDFVKGIRTQRYSRYAIQSMLPCVNECVVQACEELGGIAPMLEVSSHVAQVA